MPRKKNTIHWVALQGAADISANSIKYTPTLSKEGPNSGQTELCILRSDRYFQSGEVTFEAHLSSEDSRCQLILNHGLDQEIFIGLNLGANAYGIATYKSGKWDPLATSGFGHAAKKDSWLKIEITVDGSTIHLFVDDVLVLSSLSIIQTAQLGFFLHGTGDVQIRNIQIKDKKPKAFIVMQFTEEFNSLYQEVIRPTCEKYGYETIRADDIYNNGLIIDDITRSIEESSVIIADITPSNLNVYYEVGYAHGIKKPTILLCEKTREKLPFDVSGFRSLFYENTIGGKSHIEDKLNNHLERIKG